MKMFRLLAVFLAMAMLPVMAMADGAEEGYAAGMCSFAKQLK